MSRVSESSRVAATSPWILTFRPRADARVRLFCFHHAGGGAATFRPWASALPDHVELCAVQLPGRANRLREPVVSSIPGLVEALVPVIRDWSDRPFVFFGHSMGAVLAAEVTRALMASAAPLPAHVVISSRRPVHVPSDEPTLHDLDDDAFVRETNRRYGGIPQEVIADRDVLGLLLPGLRADMRALETYRPAQGPQLRSPVTVYGGQDDPIVPPAHLAAWEEETAGAFRLRLFPGTHFYLTAAMADVLADLTRIVEPIAAVRPDLVVSPQ